MSAKAAFDLPRGRVVPVDSVELRVLDGDHPFAIANRAAALANWQREIKAKPALFDGEITLFSSLRLEAGRLTGTCHMTRYSSFLHWRAMRGRRAGEHAYAHAMIVTSDAKVMAARMGSHTANAGRVYLPSGSFDRADVYAGMLDVEANMAREVLEETGLKLGSMRAEAGYHIYSIESGTVIIRRFFAEESAEELAAQVRAHIAADPDPEIEGPVILSRDDSRHADLADQMHDILEWPFG